MAEALTFSALKGQLERRKFAPVYLIHGEEGYYADELVKIFEELLPPSERDFNQYVLYAPQVEAATVMDTCRRYPMMSDYQVVILKEAQAMNAAYLNSFAPYAQQPSPTTIFVIVCRGAAVKCAELTKAMAKNGGVVFESKKLRENMLAGVISEFIKEKGLNIESKALSMLQDYVGSDLSRIYNEVDKLTVVLGPGAMITPEAIERNIGISKDFNNFELVAALARRDAAKCYRIVEYFRNNPKNNPTPVTCVVIFNYFSNLLLCAYAKDKSDRGLMEACGFRFPGQLTDIKPGLRNYNAWQMIAAISAIRRFDTQTKGISSRFDSYDLLTQLVFTLLNTDGRTLV